MASVPACHLNSSDMSPKLIVPGNWVSNVPPKGELFTQFVVDSNPANPSLVSNISIALPAAIVAATGAAMFGMVVTSQTLIRPSRTTSAIYLVPSFLGVADLSASGGGSKNSASAAG